MKIYDSIKKIVIQTALLAALIVMAISFPAGSLSLNNLSTKFDHFNLVTTNLGVAIHQNEPYTSYISNAYNDYVIDKTGTRWALVPYDEDRLNVKQKQLEFWQNLYFQGLSLFDLAPIEAELSNNYQIRHETDNPFDSAQGKKSNFLIVTRIITDYPRVSDAQALGSTMSYERDDLIFDATGILYTENTDKDVELFESIYSLKLTKHTQVDRRPAVGNIPMFVVNPHVTGVLKVVPKVNQTVFINKDYRLIELESPNIYQSQDEVQMQMGVEVYQNPVEAVRSLKIE